MRFFICYRRVDSRFLAYLIGDFLRQRVGPRNVFIDVESVAGGQQIWEAIERELSQADFVLAVIGPSWDVHSTSWVGRELSLATNLGIPILPIFHSGAIKTELLNSAALPAELASLAGLNALEIADPPRHLDNFETDLRAALLSHGAAELPQPRAVLSDIRIGLSTSEPDHPPEGQDEHLVRHAIVALPEAFLAAGASITFGGMPPDDKTVWNITRRLQDLAQDFPPQITNVALHDRPMPSTFHKGIRLVHFTADRRPMREPSDAALLASDLVELRQSLIQRTHTRVCLGGGMEGFKGRMPGVFDEVAIALKARQPVFLLGGFGGATQELARTVRGEDSNALDPDHYKQADGHYRQLTRELGTLAPPFDWLRSELAQGAQRLGNGLDVGENDLLMTTTRWRQAIDLVTSGLTRLNQAGRLTEGDE